MKVGDLVRIKQAKDTEYPLSKCEELYLGKLAIIVVNGTWSVDVVFIDPSISWKPRIAKEHCEVLS